MRRSIEEIREQFHLDLEELEEEMRKIRNESPYQALVPLGLGAGFTLVLIVVGTLIMRHL
ncbi:hypothetical protein ACIPW4_16045 [Pseudomonas sp. NPDC089996]|uniref:hypothetical protein n=1 Tax=Pseudomonas sp. NPDC089996 TaxID=3364474 RepID=UPI00382411B9